MPFLIHVQQHLINEEWLENKLSERTGADVDVTGYAEKLLTEIVLNVSELKHVDMPDIRKFLDKWVPAHLMYKIILLMDYSASIGETLAENACQNGAEFYFDTAVEQIEKTEGGYRIHAGEKTYETRCVVNAAGVYADVFHNMVSEKKIRITPRKGEYYLLDKKAGTTVHHTIFQIPGAYGKGVLVTPTTHGNLLVGPTAVDIEEKEGTNTTKTGLDEVAQKAVRSVPNLPLRQVITSFAGLRAHEDGHEFIIREVEDAEGFFDCAGIESPGLTSAPAIGELVAELVTGYLCAKKKQHFEEKRKGLVNPKNLSREAYQELIRENPAYGNVICRCETVTEGEIVEAIHRLIPAKSLDGVKRRTRAGMGRCQAGFCSPKTMEILAREWKVPMETITKAGKDSRLIRGYNKDSLFPPGSDP